MLLLLQIIDVFYSSGIARFALAAWKDDAHIKSAFQASSPIKLSRGRPYGRPHFFAVAWTDQQTCRRGKCRLIAI